MIKYIAKRLVQLVLIVFVISVGAFFLVHLLPGNPAITILGPAAGQPGNEAIVLHQLGLDKPLWEQYFVWAGHVLQGNLGESFIDHQSVTTAISQEYPFDLELIVISQIIAMTVAIPLALMASRRPNKAFDRYATSGTFAFLAMPPFVIAPIVLLVFTVELHWFPGAGSVTYGQPFWTTIHDELLPSIVLALGSIVVYYRLLRNDLIATLQQDFITMARSKGLTNSRILWRHALRPSSISLLASAGINIAGLIAGTFIVEYLFHIDGLGYGLVYAIGQDDYITVQGITLVVAVAVILLNFTVDFLFTVVDPRIIRE